MENTIRLITADLKSENYNVEHEDIQITKDLNLLNHEPIHNFYLSNEDEKTGCTLKIPLNIWKFQANLDSELIEYKNDLIQDKANLRAIATGINCFYINPQNQSVYMRDASLDYFNIGKGDITYNKEKGCAILTLEI